VKNLLYKLIAAFILTGSLGIGWLLMDYNQFIETPITVDSSGLHYDIVAGDNLKKISRQLYQQGVLSNPRYLVWMAKWQGTANQVKKGEYLFEPGTTPEQLLHKIVNGEVIQYSATIIEGMTFREMMDSLNENEYLVHTLKRLKPKAIMAKLGYSGQHPEGRFMPDTYNFPRGTTDVEFLQRAYHAMEDFLNKEWENREVGTPLKSTYDALILASIVEKETAVPAERSMIAGVFTRRLQKHMRLQTDPTVIYGLGDKYDGNIHRRDLVKDTPYNTYRHNGLPPTPIAMPGHDAIKAAINPADGDALYFVAKGDGSHVFTSNLRDHNNAVIKYQLKGKRRRFSSMP
jgi:UPF0755 protein